MLTKKYVQAMVDSIKDILIEQLRLTRWKITFHVINSNTKKAQEMCWTGEAGICLAEKRTANIIIYADKQRNKKDCVGTIVHELLHVKMQALTNLIADKYEKRGFRLEERIVVDLERFIVDNLL